MREREHAVLVEQPQQPARVPPLKRAGVHAVDAHADAARAQHRGRGARRALRLLRKELVAWSCGRRGSCSGWAQVAEGAPQPTLGGARHLTDLSGATL